MLQGDRPLLALQGHRLASPLLHKLLRHVQRQHDLAAVGAAMAEARSSAHHCVHQGCASSTWVTQSLPGKGHEQGCAPAGSVVAWSLSLTPSAGCCWVLHRHDEPGEQHGQPNTRTCCRASQNSLRGLQERSQSSSAAHAAASCSIGLKLMQCK